MSGVMRGKVEFTVDAQAFTFLLQNAPYDTVQLTEKITGAIGTDSWVFEWIDEDGDLHQDPASPLGLGFGVRLFPARRFRGLKATFTKDSATVFLKVKTFQTGREDVDPTSAYPLLSRTGSITNQDNLRGD